MIQSTSTLTLSRPLVNALLGALTVVPGGALLTAPKVGLYTNAINPSPDSLIGDFTVATFTGYAAQNLTLVGADNVGPLTQGMYGTVTFTLTGGSPQNVVGYVLTNGAGTVYYGGERFAAPVAFVNAGDVLILNVIVPLPARQLAA